MTIHFFNKGTFLQDHYVKFKVDEAKVVHDKEFFSVDHWMIFIKDILYNNGSNAEEILLLNDPSGLRFYDASIEVDSGWEKIEQRVSLYGNFFKFFQNPGLALELLKTGSSRDGIAYTELDNKWGIGLNSYDVACPYPELWEGKNWLGENLVEVRDMLERLSNFNSSLRDCEEDWMEMGYAYDTQAGKIADKVLDKMGKAFKGRPRVEIKLENISVNTQTR